MTDELRPRLRPIQAVPYDSGGERLIYLRDTSGVSKKTLVLPLRTFYVVALMDGTRTLRDIQTEYARRFGDILLTESIAEVVTRLDEALMLEGARAEAARRGLAEEFARAPTRKAAHAGAAYPARPQGLVEMLEGFFRGRQGPGPIDRTTEGRTVAAIAAPHIDFKRGGTAYAHAWKALAEGCPAEVFVVLGVTHEPTESLYILTEKPFETPLGLVGCDRTFAQELRRRAELRTGAEELTHRQEHSIEFQAVWLRYVFGSLRPARIVPVLCGSIPEAAKGGDPQALPEVARFTSALRGLLEEYGERAAVVASVDLAHVGRQFGDDAAPDDGLTAQVEREDRELLGHAERMDAAGFYAHNAASGDRRRVCGLSALYTLLNALPARRGRLLHYGQAVTRETQSLVSFAAMAFER